MYNAKIVKHFSNPLNTGELENPDHVIEIGNPFCDDRINLHFNVDEQKSVSDVKFLAYGCSVAIATGSIFSEYILGKSVEDIKQTPDEEVCEMLGDLEPHQRHCQDILKDLFDKFRNPEG